MNVVIRMSTNQCDGRCLPQRHESGEKGPPKHDGGEERAPQG